MARFLYSYERMCEELRLLAERYPKRLALHCLGKTVDGRGIMEAVIGEESACHVLVHGGMHGREYMNAALIMKQAADWLSGESTKSTGEVCFHVLPMVNPDGCTISQQGPEGIRNPLLQKQLWKCWEREGQRGADRISPEEYFLRWKANARGVDINRNFPAGWEAYTGRDFPGAQGYKGRSPGCEEEARAVLAVQRAYPLQCSIAYHSSGNLIYWDYGSRGTVYEKDRELAEALAACTGYELRSTVGDGTDGAGCSDYFVLGCGIVAVTVETGKGDCPLNEEEFAQICLENKSVWKTASKLANFYGRKEKKAVYCQQEQEGGA